MDRQSNNSQAVCLSNVFEAEGYKNHIKRKQGIITTMEHSVLNALDKDI